MQNFFDQSPMADKSDKSMIDINVQDNEVIEKSIHELQLLMAEDLSFNQSQIHNSLTTAVKNNLLTIDNTSTIIQNNINTSKYDDH